MSHSRRDKVFISYSRDEKAQLERLLQMLAPLRRERPDTIWWDGVIKAGQEWHLEIRKALQTAKVAVLLVSPGFLASEFILAEELPVLLDAAREEGVAILWSLVRNCSYEKTPLARYQAFPYQHTHSMRAWNSMGEAELDDLLALLAREIDDRLRAQPQLPSEEETPVDPVEVVRSSEEFPREDSGGGGSAEGLLEGIDDLRAVDELGDLFVLRRRWNDAELTYDRMVDLAAPHEERWMAWGYEKLGRVHRLQQGYAAAQECWHLARSLYGRLEEKEKAAEMSLLLKELETTEA